MGILDKMREGKFLRKPEYHPEPDGWRDLTTPAPKPGTRLCAMPQCFAVAGATGLCEQHERVAEAMEDGQ